MGSNNGTVEALAMSKPVQDMVRPHLVDIHPYDPVDPPEILAKRTGLPEESIVKLNANENPYGGSPKVNEALANAPVHVYPDPLQRSVRAALSAHTGFDESHIVAGAGSGELIDLLIRLFISPGDTLLDCDPTFGMYSFYARLAGARIRLVPRDDSFEVDVPAVKEAIDERTKIMFFTSPNNPTGNLLSEADVRALLEAGPVVVVDEAYHEFARETLAGLVSEHENLVVLRTLSKWAGIAGLRIGYGFMSARLVDHIIDIKPPYNISVAAEAALLASLEDSELLLGHVDRLINERKRVFAKLQELPGIMPWPSRANFILCRVEDGNAGEVHEGLARRGIFVRRHVHERLRDCFRVSVGTPEQNDAFLAALGELV